MHQQHKSDSKTYWLLDYLKGAKGCLLWEDPFGNKLPAAFHAKRHGLRGLSHCGRVWSMRPLSPPHTIVHRAFWVNMMLTLPTE